VGLIQNVMSPSHEHYIRQCIELSRAAVRRGNNPFGALLVCDDEVLLKAENSVKTEGDRIKHAELNLISIATRSHDTATLSRCTLYTSTEPCPMCSGAIYWAGIGRVVFGCSVETQEQISGRSFGITARDILSAGSKKIEVIGPVLQEEASAVHRELWKGS